MNRTLCWRAFARTVGAAVLVASAGIGCGSEDEGSGSNPSTMTGGSGGSAGVAGTGTGGVGGGSGGSGGASGAAGMAGMTGGAGGMMTGGAGGMMTGGAGGMMTGGAGGMMTGGGDPDAGMMDPDSGMAGMGGDGECCPDGDCICREAPTGLSSAEGKYTVETYDLSGVGCVYYPTDAEPPFAAVAIADGFLGTGGCGRTQTSGWGPLYASHGIVTMIIETTGGDSPSARGTKLTRAIAAFKEENTNSGSPLNGKLAGRYGTSGFSMGGGGTTYAAADDPTLRSSVAVMPYQPVREGEVPTLHICGSSDRTAACGTHAERSYAGMPDTTDKMIITVSSGHVGQPTAGGGDSGAVGLAFQKLYLEGDERWRSVLLMADYDETNIE
jgi:hypothetical protein